MITLSGTVGNVTVDEKGVYHFQVYSKGPWGPVLIASLWELYNAPKPGQFVKITVEEVLNG
jgi:hypothetical protein